FSILPEATCSVVILRIFIISSSVMLAICMPPGDDFMLPLSIEPLSMPASAIGEDCASAALSSAPCEHAAKTATEAAAKKRCLGMEIPLRCTDNETGGAYPTSRFCPEIRCDRAKGYGPRRK